MNKKGVFVEYGIPFMYCLFIIMLIFGIGFLCLGKVRISVYQDCCNERNLTYFENGSWFKSGDYCYDINGTRYKLLSFCKLMNVTR